jgi:putative flippase GtrA/SAM-dependent methyltransferase
LFVGLTCAALHNAILIGLDRFGVHYVVSSVVSFVVVVVVGYALHTKVTFQAARGFASFVRYAAAMSANYPLIVALLFLMVTLAGLPVLIASPAGTLILFGWNYLASRWAIVRARSLTVEATAAGATRGGPTSAQVSELLGRYVPLYRRRRPVYQTVLLQSLRNLWDLDDQNMLDVGGGTGVIAQAIHDLFPVQRMVSVDVEDRFLPALSIETATYDGATLPFADASFDCVLLANVLHHVPAHGRVALVQECSRATGRGTLYIKDHVATGTLDRARLAVLDYIGNTPFHGMVKATYLGSSDWAQLATLSGYRIESVVSGAYRSGFLAGLFPNRLEITMRWVQID